MNIKKRRRINMDIFEMIDIVQKQEKEKKELDEREAEETAFWKDACATENIKYEDLFPEPAKSSTIVKTIIRRKK